MSLFSTFQEPVNVAFFQPVPGLASQRFQTPACPDLSDNDDLLCGIWRVLESSTSGRAFPQEHRARLISRPTLGPISGAGKGRSQAFLLRIAGHGARMADLAPEFLSFCALAIP
jgi:hypothetical protein